MKIKSLLIGTFIIGLGLTSCNLESDNDSNYVTGTYVCSNLVIPSDGGTAYATAASYNMIFYPYSGVISASTRDLLVDNRTYNFTTNQMQAETKYEVVNNLNYDVTSFSGGFYSGDGVVVQNLKGCLSSLVNLLDTNDPVNPLYPFLSRTPLVMSYTVNYDYTVKTFMADAIYTGSTVITSSDGSAAPYQTEGIRYRVIFSDNYKKATVIFYNANFSPAMPVTINFLLKDLDVTFNQAGYIISGKDIVPEMYTEGTPVPAPNFPFSSFEFINTSTDLTIGQAMYTVNSMGKTYNCTFNGYYVRTQTSK